MKWYFAVKEREAGLTPGASSSGAASGSVERRSPQHGHGRVEPPKKQQPDKDSENSGTLHKKKFTAVLQKTLQAGAQKSKTDTTAGQIEPFFLTNLAFFSYSTAWLCAGSHRKSVFASVTAATYS